MRRYHWIQHVSFEGPAAIKTWMDQQKVKVTRTAFYSEEERDQRLPDPDLIDGLVILGGPMGVLDDLEYDWLSEEKDFIRAYLAREKPVLGICLGAQLMADALGAFVLPGVDAEIGFHPVQTLRDAESSLISQMPENLSPFHWHRDVFEIPEDCKLLQKSAACPHQAFQLGDHALGLQYHLEATEMWVENLMRNGAKDLASGGPHVQSPEAIRASFASLPGLNQELFRILDRLFHV
jgi:GMP synthase-like glutamine amidotransferase